MSSVSDLRKVTVGLLGCGTVGSKVVQLLAARQAVLRSLGIQLEIAGVLVRDPARAREIADTVRVTDDPGFLMECELVIEVMGGVQRPLELLRPFLRSGRALVTANKAMLAERWDELRPYALAGKLYYEASVMAGTPIIGPMSTVLRASTFERLQAVVNGTCNFILGQIEQGRSYAEALRRAQQLGYAEEDPRLDVGGWDSAHKLTVLARFCADGDFSFQDVQVCGIDALSEDEVRAAPAQGAHIKLVAELQRRGRGWQARVAPQKLPQDHPLCTAGPERNALVYHGAECGELIFAGGGAGGMVTASAVVGDVLDYLIGFPGHVPLHGAAPLA